MIAFTSINSNLSAFENIEKDFVKTKKFELKNKNDQINKKLNFNKSIKIENLYFPVITTNKQAGIFDVNINLSVRKLELLVKQGLENQHY